MKRQSVVNSLFSVLMALFMIALAPTRAFSASGDYVTVIIENNGAYPVTFQRPYKIDHADFNYESSNGDPRFITENSEVRDSVTIDGNQSVVLFMDLAKPIYNVFDILSKDWGFNIKFCIQEGPCDEARISGTIKSTSTFKWSQSDNFSTGRASEMTSSELNAYAQIKGAISAMLNIVGGMIGFPGSGGLIGGLPDSQAFKVVVTQKQKTRFSVDLQPISDSATSMQINMAVKRIQPASGNIDYNSFAIQNSNIITNGLTVTKNDCIDGKLRQCAIVLNGVVKTMNMYEVAFGAIDNAGTKATVNLAYSRGALVVSNNLPFPARVFLRVDKRILVSKDIMPGGHEDLREIIPLLRGQSCNEVQDPFIPSRVMWSCPVTFNFQSDGGPDISFMMNCVLAARNGTVQSGDADEMNLYRLSNCNPSIPASLSKSSPNLYKIYMNTMLPISGMYKMISLELAASR